MVANMVKRVIMNAFIDLLSKSPMEKITVNDIVAKSGVSRQTFYNYFSDKYDLLQCIYKEDLDQSVEEGRETCLTYIDVWFELFKRRKKFYLHAFEMQGPNSLTTFLVNLHHKRATEIVRKSGIILDEQQKIQLRIYNHGSVAMIYELLKKGTNISGADLDQIFQRAAPEVLERAWGFYTHKELNIPESEK